MLYTDGLIERRDRDLDEGFAALARAADDLHGQPAETVCATLMDRLLPDQEHEDDVCLLVLRVLPAGSPGRRPRRSLRPARRTGGRTPISPSSVARAPGGGVGLVNVGQDVPDDDAVLDGEPETVESEAALAGEAARCPPPRPWSHC